MLRELLQKISWNLRNDRACLYGRFGMTIYNVKDGQARVVRRIQKKNQVVNDAREVMLQLLAQDATAIPAVQNKIWSLSVGVVGTPPQITDTGLLGEVWASAFAFPAECAITALSPTFEIVVNKTLPTTEANGNTLREAGIFTRGTLDDPYTSANRRMYCRQTHSPIEKVATMQIVYDWRLGITVEGA